MTNLTELLERVEKATGPDRFLEERIFAWANGWSFPLYGSAISDLTSKERHGSIGYTRSLDAALALVEEKLPGSIWSIANWSSDDTEQTRTPRAKVFTMPLDFKWSRAATPPLAVISALLRALISQTSAPKADVGGEA